MVKNVSRRPNRANRERPPRRRLTGPPVDPLKIVVAAMPTGNRGSMSLAREVELVRAAVLYADEIELVSPGAQMVSEMSDLADGDLAGWFGLLEALPDDVLSRYTNGTLPPDWRIKLPMALAAISLGPEVLQQMPGGDQMTDAQMEQLRHYPTQMDQLLANVREHMAGVLEDTQGDELRPAIRAGLVKVTPVMSMSDMGDMSGLPHRFVELIRELLYDRRVRLLFDESVASIARHLVAAGLASPHQLTLQHAGEAVVGSGFITRLPAFVDAPIDELMGLRTELTVPLVRYRRSVSKMASGVAAAPFDESVPHLVSDLWRSDVSPALDDLREQLATNGFVRDLLRHAGQDLRTVIAGVTGPGLWMGLGSLDSLDGVTTAVAGMVPLASAGVVAAHGAAEERRTRRSSAEKHDMFYLYEVQNRLESA